MNLQKAILLAAVVCLTAGLAHADNSGRIYGRITLDSGDRLEGLIRWDKNEANWTDILHATKPSSERTRSDARDRAERNRRKKEIRFFGIKIGESSSWDWAGSSSAGIRFGHIRAIEPLDNDRALITLKSGREIELRSSSTDLGSGMRALIIEDAGQGEVELVWDDIDRIEFMAARTDEPSRFGERLYGTLTTRRGESFTGFVCWDIDELFTKDILDGEEKNRSRKIPFEKVAAIERYSSSSAKVHLAGGEVLTLRGTNDVNESNRGIVISDPSLGDVIVKWGEFDRMDFAPAERRVTYDDFDGGRPLHGTVYTRDGESLTGTIRWDDDEEYTWEILDGEYRGVEFDIEFGAVNEIRRRGHSSAVVTLVDGREFQLRNSNDIDDSNKGIFVIADGGSVTVVEWEDFDRVVFANK